MKKQFLATAFLCTIMGQSSAMQPMAARTIGQLAKHYGKKGFSGTMTGLHWALAAGIPLKNAILSSLSSEIVNNWENADETTTYFIQSELQKTNTTIDGVKIYPQNKLGIIIPVGSTNKHIAISQYEKRKLAEAIELNDEAKMNEITSALHHEASHIRHKDQNSRAIAWLAAPFITHQAIKKVSLYNPIKVKSFAIQQLAKLPSGIGKLLITTAMVTALMRHQEKRADNEIPNDIKTLTGFKKILSEYEESEIKHPAYQLGMKVFGPHPSLKKRIAKLDQRIALLEKQPEQEQPTVNLDESFIVI